MFKVTFIDPLSHVHLRLQLQLRICFHVHFRVFLLVGTFIKMMLMVPFQFLYDFAHFSAFVMTMPSFFSETVFPTFQLL
jgi:hypothetical protein